MRRIFAAVVLGASTLPALAAGMIGSTLTFLRAYPTPETPFWSNSTETTTVAVGDGDVIDWYASLPSSGFHLTVDPEAETITFNLLTPSSFVSTDATFDGFVVSGFDAAVVSTSVAGNATGLTITPTIGSSNELHIALSGSNSANGFTLSVSLIPEPTAAMLLSIGLAGIAWRRSVERRSH